MANNHLATPGAELAGLYAQLPTPPKTYTLDGMALARERFDTLFLPIVHNIERPFVPPDSAYSVKEYTIPTDGYDIPLRRYTPAGEEGKTYPLLYWIHGGGFVFGSLELDDLVLRPLCVDLQLTIVAVDYRLAPEHPFPKGLNDAYTGLKWTISNLAEVKVDITKGFIIGGQSSGGNFAAVVTQRASCDPSFAAARPTGHILQIPVLLHPDAVPEQYKKDMTSYVQNASTSMLGASHMYDYYEKYGGSPDDPEVSPFLCKTLSDLPPAYFQVSGMDPLRDEALIYAKRLEEQGVPTKVDTYQGATHGFHHYYLTTEMGRKYDREIRTGITWLLSSPTASAK